MKAIETELIWINLVTANINSSSMLADLKAWCGDNGVVVYVLRDPFQGFVKCKLFS